MIKGMMEFTTKLNTNVKIINETLFSATSGFKKWKFLGVTIFNRAYDESIDNVDFIDEDTKSKPSMGFNKVKEKK